MTVDWLLSILTARSPDLLWPHVVNERHGRCVCGRAWVVGGRRVQLQHGLFVEDKLESAESPGDVQAKAHPSAQFGCERKVFMESR